MLYRIGLMLAILSLTIFSGRVFSQVEARPDKPQPANEFISVDGEFAIALPSKVFRFEPVEPERGTTAGGSKLGWNTPEAMVVLSFEDYLKIPENPSKIIARLDNDSVRQTIAGGGKLIENKELSFNGNPGLQTVLRFADGKTMLHRYFFVKNRLFIMTTGWNKGENGERQLKILDSFRSIDPKTVNSFQTEETAAPKILPQTPATARPGSEAADENLKGRVRLVVEEIEYPADDDLKGRYFQTITGYNENGNRIRQLSYLIAEPLAISLFGYLDGMRVLADKTVADIPDLSFLSKKGPKPPKPPDPRYTYSIEYKFTDGKMTEQKWLKNDGREDLKIFYVYRGNQVEETVYDEWGRVNSHTVKTLDEKGNPIEETDINDGNRRYVTKYDAYDEQGNWTESTKSERLTNNGKETLKLVEKNYRTIIYYP